LESGRNTTEPDPSVIQVTRGKTVSFWARISSLNTAGLLLYPAST